MKFRDGHGVKAAALCHSLAENDAFHFLTSKFLLYLHTLMSSVCLCNTLLIDWDTLYMYVLESGHSVDIWIAAGLCYRNVLPFKALTFQSSNDSAL